MRIVVPFAAVLQQVAANLDAYFLPRRCLSFWGPGNGARSPETISVYYGVTDGVTTLVSCFIWHLLGANCFRISIFLWQLPNSESAAASLGLGTRHSGLFALRK
ncbi:hypothetical protein V8C40DRAFT_149611 [Trichoderma camerunense]